MSEETKTASEFTKMRAAEFANFAMHNHIAPRSVGPVKTRLGHAQRILGKRKWTPNRVRDLWYLDPRASEPKWDEIKDIEELTGLQYARRELNEVNDLIAAAERLNMAGDTDFTGAFVAAVRAFFGAPHRAGTQRRSDQTD